MAITQRKATPPQHPIRVAYPMAGLWEPPPRKRQVERDEAAHAMQINSVLQTTLELHKIVELFSTEMQTLVPHDGLIYAHDDDKWPIAIGTRGPHSCAYKVSIGEQSLGALTVTRKKRFTARETALMEYMLCGLIYPLRNALLYKQALQQALRDPLTGVNNRAAMDIMVNREIELARRHGTPLSMIALDIDRFKKVNDNYGHVAGDSILKAVAETMTRCIRSSDILFRYGGEEFAVVLSNTGPQGAMLLAERIREAIAKRHYQINRKPIGITVSQGVACLEDQDEIKTWFMRADAALYQAKSQGRNCVRCDEGCI